MEIDLKYLLVSIRTFFQRSPAKVRASYREFCVQHALDEAKLGIWSQLALNITRIDSLTNLVLNNQYYQTVSSELNNGVNCMYEATFGKTT